MTGLPGFPPYSYYYCKYESFTCTVKDTDEKVYIVEGLEWAQTFRPHGVSGLIFVAHPLDRWMCSPTQKDFHGGSII